MLALSAVRSTCLFPSELAFWRGTVVVVGSSGWSPSFWLSELCATDNAQFPPHFQSCARKIGGLSCRVVGVASCHPKLVVSSIDSLIGWLNRASNRVHCVALPANSRDQKKTSFHAADFFPRFCTSTVLYSGITGAINVEPVQTEVKIGQGSYYMLAQSLAPPTRTRRGYYQAL